MATLIGPVTGALHTLDSYHHDVLEALQQASDQDPLSPLPRQRQSYIHLLDALRQAVAQHDPALLDNAMNTLVARYTDNHSSGGDLTAAYSKQATYALLLQTFFTVVKATTSDPATALNVLTSVQHIITSAMGRDSMPLPAHTGTNDVTPILHAPLATIGDNVQMLRARSDYYRSVVEDQTELICRFVPDGSLTFSNAAFCRYFHCKNSSHDRSLSFWQLLPPAGHADMRALLESLSATQSVASIDLALGEHNGTECWQHWTVRALLANNTVIEYQAVGQDISDRKSLEQSFRDLVEHSLQGVCIFQHNGLVFVNPAMAATTGYDETTLLSWNRSEIDQVLYREDRETFWTCIDDHLAGRPSLPYFEGRIVRKYGQIIWVEVSAVQTRYQGQRAVQMVINDINDRRRAEEELRERESIYRAMFEKNQAIKLLVDPDTLDIVDANAAACAFYDQPIELLRTRTLATIHMQPAAHVRNHIERALGEQQQYFKLPRLCDNGEIRDVEVYASPLEVHGRMLLFAIVHDITERERAETALRIQRDLALQLSSTRDIARMTGGLLNSLRRFDGIDSGCVYLEDPPGSGTLVLKDSIGFSRPLVEYIASDMFIATRLTPLAQQGTSHYNTDPALLLEPADILKTEHLASIALIPVLHEQHVIAVWCLASHLLSALPESTRTAVESVAAQIGVSIARVQTEAALRLSESRFNRAIKAARGGVWEWNLLTHTIYLSDNLKLMLGYQPNEITNTMDEWASHVHPEDMERLRSAARAHINGQNSAFEVELRMHCKDTQLLWFMMRGEVVRSPDGTPLQMVGTSNDITALKHTEALLRESEQKFRGIVEQSSDGISLTDEHGVLIEWNRGAEDMTGLKRDEFIGKPYATIMARLMMPGPRQRESWARYLAEFDQLLHTGQPPWGNRLLEQELLHEDGHPIVVQQHTFAIETHNGYMACAIFRDITEQRKAQEELQKARETAEEATRVKSEFLANMSHEIRTPLNVIIGMSTLLIETRLTHEQYDFVETTRNSSEALLDIINDILDFSKIEAGKLKLEYYPFDIRTCIEKTLDMFAAKAAEKGVELAYFLDEHTPEVLRGDMRRLRQILVNLVNNAVKFTDSGEIFVSVAAASDDQIITSIPAPDAHAEAPYEIYVSVRDTGIGIAPDKINQLFQSFSQVHDQSQRPGGTGLGLAISKSLANMMGGDMWVESELGRGSIFNFTFLAEAVTQNHEFPLPAFLNHDQPLLTDKQVLIVDDNATNRLVLTRYARMWGMHPRVCATFDEVRTCLLEGLSFDVVIIDALMHENEQPLADYLNQQAANLPLVAYTTLVSWSGMSHRSDAKVYAYLTRPIKPLLLYETLLAVVSGEPVSPGQRLRAHTSPFEHTLPDDLLQHLRILLAEDVLANQKVALRFLENIGCHADIANNGEEVLQRLAAQDYDIIFMDVQMPVLDGVTTTSRVRDMLPTNRQPWIIAMTAYALEGDRQRFIGSGMDDYVSKPIRTEELIDALQRYVLKQRPMYETMHNTPSEVLDAPHVRREAIPNPTTTLENQEGFVFERQELPRPSDAFDQDMLNRFLQTIGKGGPQVITEIISIFIKDMEERLASLAGALEGGTPHDLKVAAHSLKSLSAQVGAMRLSHLSLELEAIGLAGTLTGAKELVEHAQNEFVLVRAGLEARKQQARP